MHLLPHRASKSQDNQTEQKRSNHFYIRNIYSFLYDVCYAVGMISFMALRKAGHIAGRLLAPVGRLAVNLAVRFAVWLEKHFGRRGRRIADLTRRSIAGMGRLFQTGVRVRKEKGLLPGIGATFRLAGEALVRHRGFVRYGTRLIAPTLSLALLVATISVWSTATFALEVNLDGKTVGYVADENVFADACALMNLRVVDDGTEGFSVDTPKYSMAMVSSDQLLDAAALCDELITASCDEISEACGIYVDGELIAVTEQKDSLQTVLENILTAYLEEPQVVDAAFVNEIVYKEGLYPIENIVSADTAETLLTATHAEINGYTMAARATQQEDIAVYDGSNAQANEAVDQNPSLSKEITAGPALKLEQDTPILNVKLVRTEEYEESIAFESEEVEDSSKLEGYRKVNIEGEDGKKLVTANVEYVDGQEVSREIVHEETLQEPVNEQVIVGTRSIAQASQKVVSMRQMLWPVANVSGSYVSSYFGDGRNHKGLDISAPAGTPIYAAETGTVVSVNGSGWAYGLHFVVDHGNGVQTLYSHCNTIDVEVGQQVARGQQIATVGRTGNATGNHLHFEVRVGGTPYNPAAFLGLS